MIPFLVVSALAVLLLGLLTWRRLWHQEPVIGSRVPPPRDLPIAVASPAWRGW